MNQTRIKGAKFAGAVLLVGCVVSGTIPARAGLGGDASSIASDAVAMTAKMSAAAPAAETNNQPFSTASFITARGVTVREYAAPSGSVFGVAWQGPRPPDMSTLLGSYYPEYLTAAAAQKGQIGLHHSIIVGPKSVVILSGHMGNLSGRAYAPGLAPSGVDPTAVVK